MVMIRAEGKPKKIYDQVRKSKNLKPDKSKSAKFKMTVPYLQH